MKAIFNDSIKDKPFKIGTWFKVVVFCLIPIMVILVSRIQAAINSNYIRIYDDCIRGSCIVSGGLGLKAIHAPYDKYMEVQVKVPIIILRTDAGDHTFCVNDAPAVVKAIQDQKVINAKEKMGPAVPE